MSRLPLKVMISSRVLDEVEFDDGTKKTMAVIRGELKTAIEALQFGGENMFKVWINEFAPAASGDDTSWEHCMDWARRADIVLSLFNGNAGWAKTGGDIGICHAELEVALQAGRGRVRLLKLPDCGAAATGADKLRNDRFTAFINQQNLFRAAATLPDDVSRIVLAALRDAVLDLARRGKASSKADRHDRGPALKWSRMSFTARKTAIEASLVASIKTRGGVAELDAETFELTIEDSTVIFRVAGIPGPMTVAEARELVGRPHLRDHDQASFLESPDKFGPVHLIACHRGITETQALKVLGFPDAVVVTSGFGVYVADNVQKAQLVFLRECRDDTGVRHSAQLFFDWLDHSGEGEQLVERATGRRKVVLAVAELHAGGTS